MSEVTTPINETVESAPEKEAEREVVFEEAVLYNNLGQKVMSSNTNKIDVSSLESGLYILKLDNTITRKVAVKH